MLGKTIGNYTIAEQIGVGGMGEIYRATDSRLGRDVAVKIIPPEFAGDPERLSRFEREARLLASLNHPNVAAVHGLETEGDVTVLVMELIPGDDLAVRIGQGPASVDEALDIMRQVAEGLGAAHDSGIFHRDLKPANIKVTPDGTPKVLDFGLAKSDPTSSGATDVSQSPTITHDPTQAGVILGTAAYMSPEQARGKPVDRRTDIWSFGAVLFELLTGDRVFGGETVSDTLAAVLRKAPEWETIPADTPRAITRLLKRCLERDQRSRLQDIGEARIIIEKVRSGEDTAEEPATAERKQKGRTSLIIVATAIVAFIAGWFGPRILGGDKTTTATQTIRRHEFRIADSEYKTPRFSPDGSRFLYVDDNMLWIRELTSYQPHPIPGTEGMYMAAFSPDGEELVGTDGTRLFRMPAEGGRRTKIATLPEVLHPFAGGIVWTNDDRVIFVCGNTGLFWIPSSGGDVQDYMPVEEGYEDYHHLEPLPDDRGLLYVIHSPNAYGTLGLCVDGVGRELLTEASEINYPVYSPTGHIIYERSFGTKGLWAVPFSLDRLEVTGAPFLVEPDSHSPAVSSDGTLVHSPGSSGDPRRMQADIASHLIWMTRDGAHADTIATTQRARYSQLAVSPNGRYVATSEVENENWDIWIYDLVTGGTRRLTSAPDEDLAPVWSPDGGRLYYTNGAEGATVNIRSRAPDGERILVQRAVDPEAARPVMRVVENWFAEFEK
jgi:serine/threonine protein kinase